MLARARTFTIEGLQTRPVTVEVDIRAGLPAFTIVGLAGAAVREARDRVRAAILNSGYEFPERRITANLAPADIPKVGPGLDLALACAVLAASGQLSAEPLERHALFGELSLDGEVRPCHGTLAIAQAAREEGTCMRYPRGRASARGCACGRPPCDGCRAPLRALCTCSGVVWAIRCPRGLERVQRLTVQTTRWAGQRRAGLGVSISTMCAASHTPSRRSSWQRRASTICC